MRVHKQYTVTFGHGHDGLVLPLRLSVSGEEYELSRTEKGGRLETFVPVEAGALLLHEGESFPDGHKNPPSIKLPEREGSALQVHDVVSALTFLTDVRMDISSAGTTRLLPDSDADRDLLTQFGTDQVHEKLSATIGGRTFGISSFSDESFEKLLERRAGLHLYDEAMHLGRPVAKFRELWRVLESAFDRQDDALVELLAQYPPALELKFARDELKKMLVLRGRASHAATRGGVSELRKVNREATRAMDRLSGLVEQVILTKKTWGAPTLGVDRLAPVTDFTGPDGTLYMFRQKAT